MIAHSAVQPLPPCGSSPTIPLYKPDMPIQSKSVLMLHEFPDEVLGDILELAGDDQATLVRLMTVCRRWLVRVTHSSTRALWTDWALCRRWQPPFCIAR
jgi:hypothetical protein